MTDSSKIHEVAEMFPPLGEASLSLEQFQSKHKFSIEQPDEFWKQEANERLTWSHPFHTVHRGGFDEGDTTWFEGGKLNVCYNAIDRHPSNKVAMVWEGDEPDDIRKITYGQLRTKISQISHALQSVGVQRGDVVTIYMPMIPELAMTMLACARMGAVHSVVFAGFSADALAQRIEAAHSKVLVTADVGKRGGKTIPLKDIVDNAKSKVHGILQHTLVWERFFNPELDAPEHYDMHKGDIRMDILVANQRPYFPPVDMDSEDPLFFLFTSGSTGKPKGLLHTTGGYALYAAFTTENTFQLKSDTDLFACVADCGWITGHTYVVYGPLLNGATTFLFESTPVYPNAGRYWDMIVRHNITQFYTAPTAIRLLMRYGDEIPSQYDMHNSLRVLGSVGEPINPEAWRWYYEVVGKKLCTVVDTYWQTETGGHIVTNLPGITPMKPGSCTFPSYGIDTIILDPLTGQPQTERDEKGHLTGVLAVKQPWPGMARTCLGDHERYLKTYLKVYNGYYFTGDSAYQDKDGYTFIIGRVDDVLNVSGHRIGTAEVESALVAHVAVAQAAVVGQPHEIKGQSIAAFVMLVTGAEETDELIQELRSNVKNQVGSFAAPDLICVSSTLPMTRSGKIMRRILRKIVCNEADQLGDTSTLADPEIVDVLIDKVAILQGRK